MSDPPSRDEQILGLRCAWCGLIMRWPVGFPQPDHPLSWTHGMCRDCQRRFEQDARQHRS